MPPRSDAMPPRSRFDAGAAVSQSIGRWSRHERAHPRFLGARKWMAPSAFLAGVDQVDSDLKPEQKVERIVELAQKYGPVLMVGDGVNDAPALAAASVGVAMGAAGTDVALETADVALMADDLEKLVDALRLARRNQTVVRQNLALSTLVITGLVLGALTGLFSLTTAVIGHEVSEFLVIASGLRMLRD